MTAAFLFLALAAAPDPAKLLADAAMFADVKALPELNGKTSTIYRAVEGQYQFNLHSYLAHHQGKFWAVWSSGLKDEDTDGQAIRYATSEDGHRWSEGKILAPDPDGTAGPGFWICRGVFVAKGKLTALLAKVTHRAPRQWPGLQLHRYEWDGREWKSRGVYLDDCMNNYPPDRLGSNWFMTCRDSKRAMSMAVSRDLVKWTRAPLPGNFDTSEPSSYVDAGGVAHTIFRDQGRSGFLHRSLSRDQGVTWSAPVRTDYPDATSKNFSGRLSNGWYYLINNPDRKSRDPLAISFSRDGWTFGRPHAIRARPPARRYAGAAKGSGSVQYPHAIERGGSLWVVYATNKEDIEVTELPLTALAAAAADPKKLLSDESLLADPLKLRPAPGRHSMVFRGTKGKDGFNLHSYIAHFDGRFWAAWSNAMTNEEDPDQHIRYATSRDGHSWSEPAVLAPDPDGPAGPKRWITRGLFVEGGKLQALGALVESAAYGQRGKGVVWQNLKLMRYTWTGKEWAAAGLYADNCMNNFPAVRIAGMLSMPCRDRDMSVSYLMSDSPASGWKTIPISNEPPFHRMDEPTVYQAADGTVHLIVRDGTRSRKLIRIVSRDAGKSWEAPVLTNYPDTTSKNFAARLSDGRYYLINNPNPARRDPLAISFSADGWEYGNPLALRVNAAPARSAAHQNVSGSFQYPHAMEHAGSLWVIYSTNKEDIEVSEFKLRDLR